MNERYELMQTDRKREAKRKGESVCEFTEMKIFNLFVLSAAVCGHIRLHSLNSGKNAFALISVVQIRFN